MRRNLPSTVALQCFEAAARYSNFTRAAEELNLTQGAVSRQIRLLEDFLGQSLFTRHRRRVDLTPAGRAFLSETGPLLSSLEAAVARLRRFGSIEGGISIGCYPTLGSRWLLPLTLAFSETFPDIAVNMVTYASNGELNPEAIDIGIVQGNPPFRGMSAEFLMQEGLAVVVSPHLLPEPVENPADLLACRAIHLFSRPVSWQIWFRNAGRPLSVEPDGLSYGQFDTVIEAATRGSGIAVVPTVLVESELADGRLILAHPHIAWTKHNYYIVTPRQKEGVPRIDLIRDWILARASGDAEPVTASG